MELPASALRWLVQHSSSNADVAVLSNVCQEWRRVVSETVLQMARDSLNCAADEPNPPLLLLPSMLRYILSEEEFACKSNESFCLAWFDPSGIEYTRVLRGAKDDSDDTSAVFSIENKGNEPQPFAPSGVESYIGSEEERKVPKRQAGQNPRKANGRRIDDDPAYSDCLYQWTGYQSAYDVLVPFGYSYAFVKDLLQEVQTQQRKEDSQATSLLQRLDAPKSPPFGGGYSTHAVRGAIFARPEGYCLCWDDDAVPQSSRSDGSTRSLLRQQELVMQRKRRRRELKRELLPKVLGSAPRRTKGSRRFGIPHPSVQFLNVDASHAVRLFTPPFKPGPVPTPITVFCVGIATEDGCFMSGLRNRFELGHLYPETILDDLIERSPVCLSTDKTVDEVKDENDATDDLSTPDTKSKDCNFDDDSSYDASMAAARGDPGQKCGCPFSGLVDVELDDEDPGQICRGRLGPGAWHCYVAVFDGVDSIIRIDGANEPTRYKFPLSTGKAYLDGLTIGADHLFDMSLCFGQGSDGEGMGAIAELAVFKGRLDLRDIELMERRLMAKYEIVRSMSEKELIEENYYSRLAHAMLSCAPGQKLFNDGSLRVPLRFMTRHRFVAWSQANPVTGQDIRVSRIGSRDTGSSSDW